MIKINDATIELESPEEYQDKARELFGDKLRPFKAKLYAKNAPYVYTTEFTTSCYAWALMPKKEYEGRKAGDYSSITAKYLPHVSKFYGRPVQVSFSWNAETFSFENPLRASEMLTAKLGSYVPVSKVFALLKGVQKSIPLPTAPKEKKRRVFIRPLEDAELPQFYADLQVIKDKEREALRLARETTMTNNNRHYSERY